MAALDAPRDDIVASGKSCPEWCIAMHLGTTPGWNFLKLHLPKLPLEQFDLYVTIVKDLHWSTQEVVCMVQEIRTLFAACPRVVIELMPNCDLDVGGFFNSLHTIIKSGRPYKYIYKTHSKSIQMWMESANMPLIDGFAQCQMLMNDPTVGMVCAVGRLGKCPDIYDMDYYPLIHQWLDTLGYPSWPKQTYGFSLGAIFMMRLSILKQWLDLIGGTDCLLAPRTTIRHAFALLETRPVVTYEHWLWAVERFYGILVTRSGYSIRGLMHTIHTTTHDIPVVSNVYVDKPILVAPPTSSSHKHVTPMEHLSFDAVLYLVQNEDIRRHCAAIIREDMLLTASKHWIQYGQYEPRGRPFGIP